MKTLLQQAHRTVENINIIDDLEIEELEDIQIQINQMEKLIPIIQNEIVQRENKQTLPEIYQKKHKTSFKKTMEKINELYQFKNAKKYILPNCENSYCSANDSCQMCFFTYLNDNNHPTAHERLKALNDFRRSEGDLTQLETGYDCAIRCWKK